MGNLTDTTTRWSYGILKNGNGRPDFAWGRGELTGGRSPVVFSAETGQFSLNWPRETGFATSDYQELVDKLMSVGLSAPPEAQRVQNIRERFAEMLVSVTPDRVGEIYDQLEHEWRQLFENPRKM